MQKRELPEGWEWKRLGDVIEIGRDLVNDDKELSRFSSFIGLENIESNEGIITGAIPTGDNGIKSSKFRFTLNDILYGKLRPYLNKVALPDFNGICSTDILVIKPISEKILRQYLAYFMRSEEFVSYATTRSSGANLPRINPNAILEFVLPLPPLPIQHRIVETLDQADALRRLRAQADVETQKLLQSVFYKMFGDPMRNEKGWEIVTVSDVLKKNGLSYGILKPGIFDENGVKMLRVIDIGVEGLNNTGIFKVKKELAEQYKRTKLQSGDIVLAIMATVGRCMVIPDSLQGANVNRALAVLKFNEKVTSQYMCFLIKSDYFQNIFLENKIGSSQLRINLADLRVFKIPLPPLPLQRQFDDIVKKIEQMRDKQNKTKKQIEFLFGGLTISLFKGEFLEKVT